MRALKEKSINLIHRLKDNPARDALIRRRLLLLSPVLAIVLFVLAFKLCYSLIVMPELNRERTSLTSYINLANIELADETPLTTLLALCEGILSYPQFDHDLWSNLSNPATQRSIIIRQVSFDQGRGALTLSCEGPLPESAERYVRALSGNSAFFSSVTYSGYTETRDRYIFTVNCVLAPKGGGSQ
ncbi:MAG: hypothetical protein FWD39_02315 [Clostridiales bacterium]|nr:hypothetical protein [Clostridiales bacterium]